jgi:hypothetical protein
MTAKETKEYIKNMKEFTKKISSSKKESRKFLDKTGIYTKSGKLSQKYK